MHVSKTAVALAATLMLVQGYTWVAATQTDGDDSVQTQGAPIDDDLVTAGRRVAVDTEVAGDVAAAGGNVTVHGEIKGYLMGAGRSVTVHGAVGNDVWAAGETVSVDSAIGNNAMLAGREVSIGRNAVIGHDARLAGNVVTAEGRVERNLDIGAETARIGGEVGGTVHARADRVSLLPGAVIRGDLVVRANEPPEMPADARVLGEVRYEDARTSPWAGWAGRWLYFFVALLILGVTAVAFAPAWSDRVAATMRSKAGASITSGLLVLIMVPLAVAALAVTIVGLPLAIVLVAFYIAMLALSGVFVSYRLGDWMLKRLHRVDASMWTRMIVGVLLVSLAMSLPMVGMIVTALIVIVGVGALIVEGRSQRAQMLTA